jgi:hypothetical protein
VVATSKSRSAGLERGHRRFLGRGGQPTVYQADPQFRQNCRQALGGDRRRLALQALPIPRSADRPNTLAGRFTAGLANPFNHLLTAVSGAATVFTGRRPGGSSSMVEVSRSA